MRRWMTVVFVVATFCGAGCAGPGKLAEKSEGKLAEGDMWKAWELATHALDKAPANPRAKKAAAQAASLITQDWQRRIVALADVDSMQAAEEMLKFADFRADAIPYTTVSVSDSWMQGEMRLRECAARRHYDNALAAAKSNRPKKAFHEFQDCQRFIENYRDAAARTVAALDKATTRVAIVPLHTAPENAAMGRDVASAWTDALAEAMPHDNLFTQIVPSGDVERQLRVSDLGKTTRDDAIRLAGKAGADRAVWGSIGPVDSRTSVQFFTRSVWHRVTVRDPSGRSITQWVETPIQVVARTRRVSVNLAYEVLSTRGRATLAHEGGTRTLEARALWMVSLPDGAGDTYALVTDEVRSAHPERAKQIESEWAQVVGPGTTLPQFIDARRACGNRPPDRATVLQRYSAGAPFVVIEDLPGAPELAQAALTSGWSSVKKSLAKLDDVDDADLVTAPVSSADE